MKQYLLSIYQPDGEAPPAAALEKVMRDMHALIEDTKTAGVWVFNGGLHPPSTATVVRTQRGEALITDGPFAESKEHSAGSWSSRRPDLDAALEWARKMARVLTLDGHDGLPIEVRPFQRRGTRLSAYRVATGDSAIERVFREEHGRAVAVLVRQFGDIDLAEEAVQDAFTVAIERWPSAGVPPSPAGWIITTARNRAIDRAAPRGIARAAPCPRRRAAGGSRARRR